MGGYREGHTKSTGRPPLVRRGVESLLEFARLRTACIRGMEKNPKNSHLGFLISDVERKEVKATHMLEKGERVLVKLKTIIVEHRL